VTVKDVLRFTAMQKPGNDSSWMVSGGLDEVLEEMVKWVSGVITELVSWCLRVVKW